MPLQGWFWTRQGRVEGEREDGDNKERAARAHRSGGTGSNRSRVGLVRVEGTKVDNDEEQLRQKQGEGKAAKKEGRRKRTDAASG